MQRRKRDLRVKKQIFKVRSKIVFFSYLECLFLNFGEYSKKTHCLNDDIDGKNLKIPFFFHDF